MNYEAERPAPLVPENCDCQGLPYMPLQVARLKDSDLVALSTGDEFKAAILLWIASWSQLPASSLPADDRILARFAGVSVTEWKGLRSMALRGWIMCSDGRLYHPIIADLAMAVFEKRRHQSARANTRWARAKSEKIPTVQENDTMGTEKVCRGSTGSMQVEGDREGRKKEPIQDRFSQDRLPETAEIISLPVRS